jgi:hypothetical protein
VGVKLIDGAGFFLKKEEFLRLCALQNDRALLFPRVYWVNTCATLAENETGKVDILVGALCL